MADPDLRSDEMVLVRTQGVYVKSIPFEGILTNKRIVLVDRAKNLLPPKEIPLATIKDVEGGENAVNDPFVTVTVITKTGETRQMVLTFTRTAGGDRRKERDEWEKTLKENVSSSFEQVIRKVIPGMEQPQRRPEVTGSPAQPSTVRPLPKKSADTIHPIKKIIENAPSKAPVIVKEPEAPAPGLGTFCSRCGNKVPDDSGFCNRCGSSIIRPGSAVPQAVIPEYHAPAPRPTDPVRTPEPLIESPPVNVPADTPVSVPPESIVQKTAPRAYSPMYDNPPEPEATLQSAPVAAASQQKPAAKSLIPRLFSPKELAQSPLKPTSSPAAVSAPHQKPRGPSRMPGKKVFIAIGVILLLIVIVAVGVIFVYPMISGGSPAVPGSATGGKTTLSTPLTSGPIVVTAATPAPGAPATGVYAHINYLGGWKGTYGMPSALQTIINSGDRFYEIENATGPVQVTIEKMDSSTRHELLVEIYKDGGLLTSGKTSEAYGKVTVAADATTGLAQAAQAGAGNVTAPAAAATTSGSSAKGNVTAAPSPAKNVTNVTTAKTTVPVTNTSTSK